MELSFKGVSPLQIATVSSRDEGMGSGMIARDGGAWRERLEDDIMTTRAAD